MKRVAVLTGQKTCAVTLPVRAKAYHPRFQQRRWETGLGAFLSCTFSLLKVGDDGNISCSNNLAEKPCSQGVSSSYELSGAFLPRGS